MRIAKSTVARRAGGICVLAAAAALTMTACSDDSGDSADDSQDTGESQQSDATEESGGSEQSDAPADEAGGAPEGEGGGGATADEAVATWIAAIIENEPVDACLVMGTPGADGTPTANTAELCAEGGAGSGEGVAAFREAFSPEGTGAPPVVEVAGDAAASGTATFDGEQITVDGQTLQDIVVSNSTGIEAGQIGLEVESTEIDGAWYVTDINLSFG
ncbi:hypothetical protein [Streptomyces marincola]|uniref:hypothetical protein n=1 Tax=Streptomyces marincola TaxID=2878388 RepID=UPI001CF340D5|nr:hypothetical protein [Streptomyces marincola]UCM88124.1 hypothetical protein LC193_09245 [Streptomyces marincola]